MFTSFVNIFRCIISFLCCCFMYKWWCLYFNIYIQTFINHIHEWYGWIITVSSSTFSFKLWFTVKRGDSTFTSIAFNWNVSKKTLSNPYFCHHFCIIASIFLTYAQTENNHPWMRGFKLLMLRSTSSSPLALICNFTSIVVQLWNSNLNACINGLYKMTSTGCSLEVQLARTNITRIFACLDLIQFKKIELLCTDHESINHINFWSFGGLCRAILEAK